MIDSIFDLLHTPFIFHGQLYAMTNQDLLAIFTSLLLSGVLFYRLNEVAKRS